ncbi:MAG: arginine--tRNA ligase [Planctomycetes bacterium]|nr:arginine--tRNA ligase [Planctomycetota bacterium]
MSRFARVFAESIAAAADLPVDDVLGLIGAPPKAEMGQLAFPCFQIAKARHAPPPKIAAEIAAELSSDAPFTAIKAFGPYVNAFLDGAAVARDVLPRVLAEGERFGRLDLGHGEAVVVDFSSPNIAKSFGIHHLRSTVIGHALVNLFEAAGYAPVGINHLGDWGTQFGQLLAIWKTDGDEDALAAGGIQYLLDLYVKFNTKLEGEPGLQDEARACFKALEDGDPEARRLWKLFRDVSLAEFETSYRRLGIDFDDMRGESFYEDKMPAVLDELRRKGLLKTSDGATVVDLEEHGLGAALVRKADGSTLYLTRDLAAAQFRRDTYRFVRALYVVGGAQALHFAQMTKVLELLGRDWAGAVEHVPFGLMRFKDRKMSTRKGDIIPLASVLDRAVELAKERIVEGAREKGLPEPDDVDGLAETIGIGAVVFSDLKNRRQRDIVFDWDEVLSFEGETGPYLQYTAARIASMEQKSGRPITTEVDWTVLDGPGELALCLALEGLSDSLRRAVAECEPSLVSDKLLEIASLFSTLYARRDWKVVSDDEGLTDARMLLAHAVRQALGNGLGWLGIQVPDRM